MNAPTMQGASFVCDICGQKTVEVFHSLHVNTSRNGGPPYDIWRCINCLWQTIDDLIDMKAIP